MCISIQEPLVFSKFKTVPLIGQCCCYLHTAANEVEPFIRMYCWTCVKKLRCTHSVMAHIHLKGSLVLADMYNGHLFLCKPTNRKAWCVCIANVPTRSWPTFIWKALFYWLICTMGIYFCVNHPIGKPDVSALPMYPLGHGPHSFERLSSIGWYVQWACKPTNRKAWCVCIANVHRHENIMN